MLCLSLPVQLLCQFFDNFQRARQESNVNDADSSTDVTEGEIKGKNPVDQPEGEPNPGKEPNAQKELEEETKKDPEDDSKPHNEPDIHNDSSQPHDESEDTKINGGVSKKETGPSYINMAVSIVKCTLTAYILIPIKGVGLLPNYV